mmetsp:Transcript_119114/g.186888  ORF Transcript_119114/g.186888 Transcript_119114/m.186888 type:complete len:141 (+) Transcript_119114:128-550(+)
MLTVVIYNLRGNYICSRCSSVEKSLLPASRRKKIAAEVENENARRVARAARAAAAVTKARNRKKSLKKRLQHPRAARRMKNESIGSERRGRNVGRRSKKENELRSRSENDEILTLSPDCIRNDVVALICAWISLAFRGVS